MNEKRSWIKKELIEWTKTIFIALILTFGIRTFVVAPFMVDGTSMIPTLKDQERVVVNEIVYKFASIKRGDIIVFHYDQQKDFIKRVVGVPGDTVQMKNDQLFINGQPIPEPYLDSEKRLWHQKGELLTEDFGPIKVESNHLFVLGDNRRDSKDSRMIGSISKNQIVGRTDIVFWPIAQWEWLR